MLSSNSCVSINKATYFGLHNTVWKFHEFSIIQILSEIKVDEFRASQSAILSHLEALKFDFYDFLHFLKAENQNNKIHNPEMSKSCTSRIFKTNFT